MAAYQVLVQPLTMESFNPFGAFANLERPTGECIGERPIEFFRDALNLSLGTATSVCFSTCRIQRRALIVDVLEYHSHTAETMMSLDHDMIVQVAPASPFGQPPPLEKVVAFSVPRGVIVMLRPGVWHHAPFAASSDLLHVLVALPERTYANDCTVVNLRPDQQIELTIPQFAPGTRI
jgi:ureidoglycolate lyase